MSYVQGKYSSPAAQQFAAGKAKIHAQPDVLPLYVFESPVPSSTLRHIPLSAGKRSPLSPDHSCVQLPTNTVGKTSVRAGAIIPAQANYIEGGVEYSCHV
ncbi:MAG: hypothetical protein JNL32_15260 [Candidatus Kapabacteria bacterium]|nr:hypothetical protein [Candidatus Kapabacteria bacterium]